MQRKQIRERILRERAHAPQNAAFTEDVNGAINEEYQLLYTERDFPFAKRKLLITLYADESAGICTGAIGAYSFTTATPPVGDPTGHYIEDPNGVRYEVSFWISVLGTTTYHTVTPLLSQLAGVVCWVRYRKYVLPQRTVRLCSVSLRNNLGNQPQFGLADLSPVNEAQWPTQETVFGVPTMFMCEVPQSNQPPIDAIVATPSAGAGLQSGVLYTYAYTYWYANRESGPSLIASATPSAGNLRITITGLENAGVTGRRKKIYRMDGSNGVFGYLGLVSDVATSYIDTNVPPADRSLRLNNEPTQRYIKVYPYQNQNLYQLQVEVIEAPPALAAETDVPLFEQAWHMLVVWRVVLRFMKRPGAANAAEIAITQKAYDDLYKEMMKALGMDRTRTQGTMYESESGGPRGYTIPQTPTWTG